LDLVRNSSASKSKTIILPGNQSSLADLAALPANSSQIANYRNALRRPVEEDINIQPSFGRGWCSERHYLLRHR